MKRIISFLLRNVPRRYLQLVSKSAFKIVALFYRGDNVQCPICKSSFRSFLPYGRVNTRSNALCPNCLSLERHRLIWLYLQRDTSFFFNDMKMLHIAPEICFMDRFDSLDKLDYTTADLESPLAKIKMDVHDIPFEDDLFDVIFCNHVLEHVENDIQALSEIKRVLKPSGWAILQVPFFHPLRDTTYEDKTITDGKAREIAFGQDDHVRMYGKDYAERLASVGFEVEPIMLQEKLSKLDTDRYAIQPDEIIYRVNKV